MMPRLFRRRSLRVAWSIVMLGGTGLIIGKDPGETLPASAINQVDELFAQWNRPDSPGCAVGIVKRGKLIYSKGIGSANLEYQVPNTPQTLFEMASLTKSFMCVCLALLMDEGKIAPEDDLRRFVPEMHAFDPPIRIQDMVRCRSGLWDQVSVPILVGWENAPQQMPHTEADFFSLLSGQKVLPATPGTEFRYSSGDFFLIGVIIKRISGLSLGEFARQRLFEPLGMSRTFFEVDPTRVVAQRAVGHYKAQGHDWRLWRPTTGGRLLTCVEDLYRWDQNFSQNRLPRGKYLDEFFQTGALLGNHACLDVDANRQETDPESRRDAVPGQYRGLERRQFTGGAWGFTCAMTQFPDQDFTVICLSNCDEIVAWTMNQRIADLLLASELQPQVASARSPTANEEPTVEVPVSELRTKVGAYRIKSTGQIWRISLENETLQLTDHLLAKYPLRPVSATRFDPEGPFYPSTRLNFSQKAPDSPLSLNSRWDEQGNRGSIEFEVVELVQPAPQELWKYAGEYVSDELAAIYRLAVRDGQLWLRVNSRRWEQLDPTVRDEFIPHLREPFDGRIIRFQRNENGDVDSLTVDYFRVTGVRFAKR